MRLGRTRFAKDIVAEYYQPKRQSSKVIIFCMGMPGLPKNQKLIEYYGKQGYWVFYPRYRGSWESDGRFLRKSPHQDILDIVDQLPKGFTDAFTNKKMAVKPSKIFLVGGSFGGPAIILASRDERITKCVLRCPVVDWTKPGKDEPLDWLEQFTKIAFGQAYRFDSKDWNKLATGKFYNPMYELERKPKSIDGSKLLILQAKNDTIVPYQTVQRFSKITGSSLVLLPKGGHLPAKLLMKPRFEKMVKQWFK